MNENQMQRILSIKNNIPKILGSQNYQSYAIFIPLIMDNDEIHLVFEKRSKELRSQPGEICFPGGRIDEEDKNSESAAIRETCEELRISAEDLTVIGPLDYVISPFETILYPYVGQIDKQIEQISPNPAEVAEIFSVPLSFLLQAEPKIHTVHFQVQPNSDFPFHLIPGGKDYNWRVRKIREYFYFYKDRVIWGLTARILHEFLENIK